MATRVQDSTTTTVMSVHDLRGRPVWTEGGERLGVVRDVLLGADGHVETLRVRDRWMFGPVRDVSAAGMVVDQGDAVVPDAASTVVEAEDERAHGTHLTTPRTGRSTVLLSGREGARGRFGGLDLLGSLFGALATIGSLVIVGGLLAAIFGTDALVVDTSLDSIDLVTDEAMLVGAATIFLSFLIGGWAAGRSARFDGVANGLMSVAWVLLLGLGLGALGAFVGDEYDVFVGAGLPSFETDELATWGIVAFLAAFALMLVAAALGGALGEAWHRRADRSMLDVVDTPLHR